MSIGVLFGKCFAILDIILLSFKPCACFKIVLRGSFSFWSSQHCAPTWFNGWFSLSPYQIQIFALQDDAIIFLLVRIFTLLKVKKQTLKEQWRKSEGTVNEGSSQWKIVALQNRFWSLKSKHLWKTLLKWTSS